MTTSPSSQAPSSSRSNGACGSSLPRWRLLLQTLNWRRNPDIERQINASRLRTKQLWSESAQLRSESLRVRSDSEQIEKEIEQLKRDNALLDWMHSEIDLIEADLWGCPGFVDRSIGVTP